MIFLLFLCLVRAESAIVEFESIVAESSDRTAKSVTQSNPDFHSDGIVHAGVFTDSILPRIFRHTDSNRNRQETGESESASQESPPLRRIAQQLVESSWIRPPIADYLTSVVVPGMVINHGKVADLGRLDITAVTQEMTNDGISLTNMTLFHGDLKTRYKYNLDGPKGRLEVKAPGRIYSIHLSSKQNGSLCTTQISKLLLHKEEELEFSAEGEFQEGLYPPLKFVHHLLKMESRATAYFNIHAAVKSRLETLNPPLCSVIL